MHTDIHTIDRDHPKRNSLLPEISSSRHFYGFAPGGANAAAVVAKIPILAEFTDQDSLTSSTDLSEDDMHEVRLEMGFPPYNGEYRNNSCSGSSSNTCALFHKASLIKSMMLKLTVELPLRRSIDISEEAASGAHTL